MLTPMYILVPFMTSGLNTLCNATAKTRRCCFIVHEQIQTTERKKRPVGEEFKHNLVICSGLGVSYISSGSIIYAVCCMHNKSPVRAAASSLSQAVSRTGVNVPPDRRFKEPRDVSCTTCVVSRTKNTFLTHHSLLPYSPQKSLTFSRGDDI